MPTNNLEQITTPIVLFLPRLGTAIVLFIVFWILAWLVRRAVMRFGKLQKLPVDVINMLGQVVEVTLIIFGIVTALSTLGVDMGAVIAGLGLVGFALGFALKDLLSNFLAGLLILIYTPFIRGDRISVSGNDGIVVEINLRYTILEDEEKRSLIPNSILFSNPVIVRRATSGSGPSSNIGK
jgi:small conductance mechanosensitive channel